MDLIYSPRLLEILKVLVRHEDYVSTGLLAEVIGVSNRTIFREIQDINFLLEPFDIVLDSKSGKGYKLSGSQENINRLIKTLEASYNTLLYKNVDERREMLMLECLQNKNLSKLNTLASIFGVSEGTISRDLDVIEPMLKKYKLDLVRKQGYGVEVVGDEENVRKAIIDIVHRQLSENNESFFERVNKDTKMYFDDQDTGILSLLDYDVISNVVEVLENSSLNIAHRITEHSYLGLVIHLTVAVIRIRNGDAIIMNEEVMASLEHEPMYRDAKTIAGDIEDRFDIKFPKAEVGYILMHLRGARPQYLNEDSINETVISNYDCMHMAESLIDRFSSLTSVDFTEDEALLVGLMAHLKPTLNRIEYQLDIRNPLLEEIKEQYSELFEIVKETTKIIPLETSFMISDDEVGYLTLHFGAALERKKSQEQVVRAIDLGVVCASGIGISALLASKIKANFLDLRDVIPLSFEQVARNEIEGIDLLVATLDVKTTVPTVYVNPLLKTEDMILIRAAIDKLKEKQSLKTIRNSDFEVEYNKDIIDSVQLITIDLNQSKDLIIKELITYSTHDERYHPGIYEHVKKREDMASVVIPEKHFVMFHASIPELEYPEIIFFNTKEMSKDNLDCGVLMIIPKPASSEDRKTMSRISGAILDQDSLVEIIRKNDKDILIQELNNYVKEQKYE